MSWASLKNHFQTPVFSPISPTPSQELLRGLSITGTQCLLVAFLLIPCGPPVDEDSLPFKKSLSTFRNPPKFLDFSLHLRPFLIFPAGVLKSKLSASCLHSSLPLQLMSLPLQLSCHWGGHRDSPNCPAYFSSLISHVLSAIYDMN